MRTHVFLRVYGIPILLAFLLFIRITNGYSAFNIFGSAEFVFSITMLALLSDKRFLQKINIENDQIRISYINHFLQSKTIEYNLDKITEVKLSKRRNTAFVWPPHLDIKEEGEWKYFMILSKELYQEIQNLTQEQLNLKTISNYQRIAH